MPKKRDDSPEDAARRPCPKCRKMSNFDCELEEHIAYLIRAERRRAVRVVAQVLCKENGLSVRLGEYTSLYARIRAAILGTRRKP